MNNILQFNIMMEGRLDPDKLYRVSVFDLLNT